MKTDNAGSPFGRILELPKNSHETLVLALEEYRGHRLLSARVYYDHPETGELRPTQKGFAVNVQLLPQLADGIAAALHKARSAGLLK